MLMEMMDKLRGPNENNGFSYFGTGVGITRCS